MTKILRKIATALAMLGTVVAIPASAAEWNTRMPYDTAPDVRPTFNIRMAYDDGRLGVPQWNIRMLYDTQVVMGPAVPSIVVLEHIYKPAVPTPMTAVVPLPPTRPRG